MSDVILLRSISALGLIGLGVAAYVLSSRLVLRRARGRNSSNLLFEPGTPGILYFTTPVCAPCKTIQRPAIQRLHEQMGDCLQVVEIDATAQPEVADEWGVLSVPTTFIIDAKGLPRHVNRGVATVDKLWRQIQSL